MLENSFPQSAEAAVPDVGRVDMGRRMLNAFGSASEDLMKRFWSGQMTADQCFRFLSTCPQLLAFLKNSPVFKRVMPEVVLESA